MTLLKTSAILGLALAGALMLPTASLAASRITAAQAKAAAVSRIPGKPLSAKYEFEDGHWQYAVQVQQGRALYEVEVNAQTGLVTATERTTKAEEGAEAAVSHKAAIKTHASAN